MITVVIVDDHPIVRAGMRAVLSVVNDINIVAEGASGADALRLVAECSPDVLVLDINLPDMSGVDVTRQLCAMRTKTAILILTVQDDAPTIFGLLECGALGYVLKDEALETLAHAVRAAAKGESWLSPAIASQVVKRAVGQANERLQAWPHDDLTPSELQVLALLSQGLDNAAIAARLVVAKRTVQNHVSNIYGKLGVNSRAEAILYAIHHRLVRIPFGEGGAGEAG